MTKYILTVTILVLTVTTHISAQAMDSGQTLAGLRDIGLIVKYGRADGLEAAKRPTTLQMLQDRARNLLRQGEVPLLQSTNEADMVGRPRLVFTVTLREQHSEISPAIGIEGKLYQRARLLRDPAQEMELATYDSGVVGTSITEQNLLALFEQIVKGFVTAYREANPAPRAESRTAEPPAQPRYNADSLQGVNGVKVLFSSLTVQFDEGTGKVTGYLGKPADSTLVRIEVEKRLKQAGIPWLRGYPEEAASPLLMVTVTLSPPGPTEPEILVRSRLWQWVSLVRDPQKETPAVTWEGRTVESAPITEESVRKVLNRHLDEFIKAYSAANPNLSPPKVKAP